MSSFRVIAIKTGSNGNSPRNFKKTSVSGVDIDYLKNLTPNTIYNFYSHYSFPNRDFSEIKYNPNHDVELYTLKLSNGKNLPININAIVGDNGSGKSTLTELIYWINYNIGCKFGLLEDKNKEKYLMNEQLDLEILFSPEKDKLCILKFKNGHIKQLSGKLINSTFIDNNKSNWKSITSINSLSDFFYSVVINYSQYALNALEVGEWIDPLFHKNDGYQTPIVLNPYREDGNIDINKEILILSRRLQANVLEPLGKIKIADSLRNLANNKIAKYFKIIFNPKYFETIEKEEKIKLELQREIIEGLKQHFGLKIANGNINYEAFQKRTIDYIYYKLKKIVFNYPVFITHRKGVDSIMDVNGLLKKIRTNDSHITFKIKGAILHLKYFNKIYKSKLNFDDYFTIDIENFSNLIENKIKLNEEFFVNTYMMAMPSFFIVEIVPDNDLQMSSFSSGEKQRIFSLSSIIYHLINLNSVEEQKSKTVKFTSYKFINLILDEIELYYHPEWQRKYVSDLLDSITKINPENIERIQGINIMFITHSPYILSDIPSRNILRLIEGEPQSNETFEETFGANIHYLLTDDFFMKEGFMGKWAKYKIFNLIEEINGIKNNSLNKVDTRKYEERINIIGETFIRTKLIEMLIQKTSQDYGLEIQIKEKEKELKTLKKRVPKKKKK